MKRAIKIFTVSACFFLALICFTVTATYAWFIDRSVRGSFDFTLLTVKVELLAGEEKACVRNRIYYKNENTNDSDWADWNTAVAEGEKRTLRFTNFSVESNVVVYVMYAHNGGFDLTLPAPTYEGEEKTPTAGVTEVEITDDMGYLVILGVF